jgi:hypothetical protein
MVWVWFKPSLDRFQTKLPQHYVCPVSFSVPQWLQTGYGDGRHMVDGAIWVSNFKTMSIVESQASR